VAEAAAAPTKAQHEDPKARHEDPKAQHEDPSPAWAQALLLPCRLTVDLPLPGFKVADVLRLQRNTIINSHWRLGTDAPLLVNGKPVASGEFEAVGDHLAIRVTELV